MGRFLIFETVECHIIFRSKKISVFFFGSIRHNDQRKRQTKKERVSSQTTTTKEKNREIKIKKEVIV